MKVDTKFSVHVRVDLSLVGIDLGSVGTAVRAGRLQLLVFCNNRIPVYSACKI